MRGSSQVNTLPNAKSQAKDKRAKDTTLGIADRNGFFYLCGNTEINS
jgi:hypothetical protein